MRKINKNVYGRTRRDCFYTIERKNNTKYGNPVFEISIFRQNNNCMVLGDVFHYIGYDNVEKIANNYIDNLED